MTDKQTYASEIRELRREIAELRAIAAERDDEQLVVENIVEFLAEREGVHRQVIGVLVKTLLGDHDGHGGSDHLDSLYDGDRHPVGFRQGRGVRWDWRPSRRWRQFGTKRELVELAELHNVPVKSNDCRKTMIRTLWRHAPEALPGAVIRG